MVRPRPNEGEPIILLEAGRFALPYRSVNPVVDANKGEIDSPIIAPSVAAQIAVTSGQQKVNFTQARQVGQVERAVHRVPHFVRVSPRTVFAQPGPVASDVQQGQPWQDVTPNWPHQVPLASLFREKQPSLDHIVIGVSPRPGGGLDIVSSNLHNLMHVLCVGSSGWGKSSWLRSFLWQLEKAREQVEVCAMDISGSELNALHGWNKLRYPVARTVGDAVKILGAVSTEVRRRMILFEQHPAASKINEYNALGLEQLTPWVVVADEGASLLNDKRTGEPLRDAIQTARQYGIYAVLATVSASATVIPTPLRDQFSTRVAFRTNSATSSRVAIENNRAAELTVRGRALVQLPGRELLEIQGPFLGRQEFVRSMAGDGPMLALPEGVSGANGAETERIHQMSADGMSASHIAQAIFGYKNARTVEKVRAILESDEE